MNFKKHMTRIYRILIIEDLPSDVHLVEREVRKVLVSCIFEWVETKKDFLISLLEFKPDIILSDFALPGFDWLTAFNLTRELSPLTPFIIVTGSTNPEIAADCIRKGVLDCISKLNIKLLGPVILKALHPTIEKPKEP